MGYDADGAKEDVAVVIMLVNSFCLLLSWRVFCGDFVIFDGLGSRIF